MAVTTPITSTAWDRSRTPAPRSGRTTAGASISSSKGLHASSSASATDWSQYTGIPAFDPANRFNASGTYLLMEKESLGQ